MQRDAKCFRGVFFSKIPSKTIAFSSHLLCNFFCCPCAKGLAIPRKKYLLPYLTIFFLKNKNFSSKIIVFFKDFLGSSRGFLRALNESLPFQHRNKMELLCVM